MKRAFQVIKQIVFALLPLIVVSLVVEFVFYLAIGKQYYPLKLQNAINYLSKSNEPSRDLSWWEDNSLTIRNYQLNAKLALQANESEKAKRYNQGNQPKQDLSDSKSTVVKPAEVKNNGKQRIYIVGCSSAYGYGVRYDSTFGCLLEKYSDGDAEVINAGQVGWSSIQLVPVVKRIVDAYKPQTMILYLSNNEWKNWAEQKPSTREIAYWRFASICTHSYALSYILYHAIMLQSNTSVKSAVNLAVYQSYNSSYFKEYKYALENPVHKYSPDFDFKKWQGTRQKYILNYRTNLLEMINYCKQHGVRAVLLTLPINYKLSPSWATPQPLYTNEKNKDILLSLESTIDSLISGGRFLEADSLVNIALGIEPAISILHYMKGVILEKTDKNLEAEASYALSREFMVGDKGSALSINNCIVELGQLTHTDVIDVKTIFDEYEHARGKYYNEDLINDDCHPNETGHQLIAKALSNYFFDK